MVLLDLFSKRRKKELGQVPDVYQYEVMSREFRTQVVHLWQETIGQRYNSDESYHEIVKLLRKEYGVFVLHESNKRPNDSAYSLDELANFFLTERTIERTIDVVEITLKYIDYIFSEHGSVNGQSSEEMAQNAINEFNERAKEHAFGYQYTDGIIVRIDSEFVHQEAVKPVLVVLSNPDYKNAQNEFLAAHEHYRHGRMAETLNECLKAFESTMKIICNKRQWQFDPNKGATDLVNVCFNNGLIPPYWQTHFSGLRSVLMSGIPTPRNKQAGHGAGSNPAQPVPEELAAYVLHMTASTILFLSKAEAKLP